VSMVVSKPKPVIEEVLDRLMNYASAHSKSSSVAGLLREVEVLRALSCGQIDPVLFTMVLLDRYAKIIEEHRRDSPISRMAAELVAYAVLYLYEKCAERHELAPPPN